MDGERDFDVEVGPDCYRRLQAAGADGIKQDRRTLYDPNAVVYDDGDDGPSDPPDPPGPSEPPPDPPEPPEPPDPQSIKGSPPADASTDAKPQQVLAEDSVPDRYDPPTIKGAPPGSPRPPFPLDSKSRQVLPEDSTPELERIPEMQEIVRDAHVNRKRRRYAGRVSLDAWMDDARLLWILHYKKGYRGDAFAEWAKTQMGHSEAVANDLILVHEKRDHIREHIRLLGREDDPPPWTTCRNCNRGKNVGNPAFFACPGSTRCDSLRMCRRYLTFPI
ncbi:MAG: hypothetical protein ABSC06_30055 [Rhodopila sp.]